MPLLDRLKPHRITISRKTIGSDGLSSYIQQGAANRKCMIQQQTRKVVQLMGDAMGHEYAMYIDIPDSSDILEGDKVIDQRGREYRVDGIMVHNYGEGSHNEISLTSQEKRP